MDGAKKSCNSTAIAVFSLDNRKISSTSCTPLLNQHFLSFLDEPVAWSNLCTQGHQSGSVTLRLYFSQQPFLTVAIAGKLIHFFYAINDAAATEAKGRTAAKFIFFSLYDAVYFND